MPADAKAIIAFKADPIGFMKANLVRAPICQTKIYGRPMKLTLYLDTTATALLGGKDIKVYSVREAEGTDPTFTSYICDFQASEISYQVLSSEADFVFTYAMDGCTFSVGSATPSGDVLVSHGNAKNITEGGSNQIERQRSFATALHGGGIDEMLEPGAYRANGVEVATTFGARINSKWVFSYLSYKVTKKSYPPGYEHLGVFDFTGTQR